MLRTCLVFFQYLTLMPQKMSNYTKQVFLLNMVVDYHLFWMYGNVKVIIKNSKPPVDWDSSPAVSLLKVPFNRIKVHI